jgi:hypothetical protein
MPHQTLTPDRSPADDLEEMIVVYLKNGEKAPLPDANHVRLENGSDARGLVLRCMFGQQEVGQFKWEDVAGYSIAARRLGPGQPEGYEAWAQRAANF